MLKALEGMFVKNVIFLGRRDERNLKSNPRFTPKTLGSRDGKKTKKNWAQKYHASNASKVSF